MSSKFKVGDIVIFRGPSRHHISKYVTLICRIREVDDKDNSLPYFIEYASKGNNPFWVGEEELSCIEKVIKQVLNEQV